MPEALKIEKRGAVKPTFSGAIFFLIHLVPILAIFTGVTTFDWVICILLYFFRMFLVTGVYHRYFAHKTYKTSRAFQFILAFLAQSTIQKGVLWWAAHHRIHHKYSDKPEDPHSMKLYGLWYSHIGWFLGPDYNETHYEKIKDFGKYKELVWLSKNHIISPIVLGIFVFLLGAKVNGGSWTAFNEGWSTLLIGFFLSTTFLFHGTYTINSVMHYFGKKRYETGDESKNSLFFALITLGEGWHNNHHYYPSATRNGFFWWEIDITYYIIKAMSLVGLVWDLHPVPKHIKYSKNLEHAKELLNQSSRNK